MGTRFIIGNLRDGRKIINLPVTSGSWSVDLDTADSISATVPLNSAYVQSLSLRADATVGKTYLAAIDTSALGVNGDILGAGPIWSSTYDRAAQTIQLTARGMQSYFDHRYVLPPIAATTPPINWTIPDPTDTTGVGTIPNPLVGTEFDSMELGSIAVSLVAQALAWTNATLPITLPAIIPAADDVDHTRTYNGPDFKVVGSALTDLINVIGGPEIKFTPVFQSDGLGISWQMITGTDDEPLIYSDSVTSWNVTAKESPVSELTIDLDGSDLSEWSWATGGRTADTTLISSAYSAQLSNEGYPLYEFLDSSHSDVSVQSTLDGYAAANLVQNATPTETWAFSVKAHPKDKNGFNAGPQLGDYNVGDFISLHIDPYNSVTNRGDLYIVEGVDKALRIIGLSGDERGDDVSIKCAPVVGS